MKKNRRSPLDGPLLDTITVGFNQDTNFSEYPFFLPIIKNLKAIQFPSQVTFFVGENGAGKSALLEAIADKVGFGSEGGSKNINFKTAHQKNYSPSQQLSEQLALSWRSKPKDGYFFRAESFFNVANYLEDLAFTAGGGEKVYQSYGGKSLHEQSHGESFLAFFKNRMARDGFYILDEPEAALSSQRQLALLVIIHDLCKNSDSQFLIATHSLLLLAYPQATIYSCDGNELSKIAYTDTTQYQITKEFLDNPQRYLTYLFND